MIHRSEAEEGAEKLFHDRKISTREEFEREILLVFEDVCGTYGKTEFIGYVLPRLNRVYGSNYRKAGLKALEMIDEGASKLSSEIGDYFQNALSTEISQVGKGLITLSEIEQKINKLLKDLERESQREYKDSYNICGAILYGSYVKDENHPDSDLDIILLTRDNTSTFSEDFEMRLERKLKLSIDMLETIRWDDDQKLIESVYEEGSLAEGRYKVVCPFKNMKDHIISTLDSYKQPSPNQ